MAERWKPEYREVYYFITMDFKCSKAHWGIAVFADTSRYKTGNCFRTEKEAQAVAEKVKALLLSLHEPATDCSQSVTDCNQLPKLTAEVFDRPDCPDWAKYAAVDEDGIAFYYRYTPRRAYDKWRIDSVLYYQEITGKWDATDWKNSLIERPAVLPEWVEIGGYVYDARNGYGKIVSGSVKSCYIEFDGGAMDFVPEAFAELKQARLREYTADEMKALVGKVIEHNNNASLVIVYLENGLIRVGTKWVSAERLIEDGFTINGKPCGKLEHLENGEWVE